MANISSIPQGSGSSGTETDPFSLHINNNLADIADKAAARQNLGITSNSDLKKSVFLLTDRTQGAKLISHTLDTEDIFCSFLGVTSKQSYSVGYSTVNNSSIQIQLDVDLTEDLKLVIIG